MVTALMTAFRVSAGGVNAHNIRIPSGSYTDPETGTVFDLDRMPQTFERSRPVADGQRGTRRQAFYKELLALRSAALMPHLDGAKAMAAHATGAARVVARWRLANSSILTIACNLVPEPMI